MENAIWNGITIIASDTSKDYEKENLSNAICRSLEPVGMYGGFRT